MNRYLPIGIDITRDGVRALQLTANGRGLSVRAAAQLPMQKRLGRSLEDLEELRRVIKALVGQGAFKGKRAVISLPHDYLHVFPVTIEPTDHPSFETALAQACSKHLAFPLEQAVIDYFSVEQPDAENSRKRRVTVVAARRDQVIKVIRTCKKAGRLAVDVIDYALCGLVRLHTHIHALTEDPIVLVHMDRESTLLAVAAKTKIMAHRLLDWGLDRLQRRIAETLRLDPESQQPQSMLHYYGVDYDAFQGSYGQPEQKAIQPDTDRMAALRVTSQILVPSMEELVRELFQIIGYARSVSPEIRFKELWLYGLANEIKSLGPFLHKRLHIPVNGMDPSDQLALHKGKRSEAVHLNSYIGALGLALREVA